MPVELSDFRSALGSVFDSDLLLDSVFVEDESPEDDSPEEDFFSASEAFLYESLR